MSRTQIENQEDLAKSKRELVRERDAARGAFQNLAQYIELRGLEIRQAQGQARQLGLFLATLIQDMGGEVEISTETMALVASRGWDLNTDESENGEQLLQVVLGPEPEAPDEFEAEVVEDE